MADTKLEKEFLKAILSLSAKPEVDHLLFVSDTALSPSDHWARLHF